MSTGVPTNDEWEAIQRKARRKLYTGLGITLVVLTVLVPLFLHFMGPVASEMRDRREALIETNYGAKLLSVDSWTKSMRIEKDGAVLRCHLLSEDDFARSTPLQCTPE